MVTLRGGASFDIPSRPVLTRADLEGFDPHAPAGGEKRRFCCPLSGCGDRKPVDAAHRSLELVTATGRWRCYRCGAWGTLREHWPERAPRLTDRAAARRAFGLDRPTARPAVPAAPQMPQHRATATLSARSSVGQSDRPSSAVAAAQTAHAGKSPYDWRAAWDRAQPLDAMPRARAYLERRGIPAAAAVAAGVRATGEWYGRRAVLFPVCDAAGELVAVSGRCLDGRDPKALSAGPIGAGLFRTAPDALAAAPFAVCEAPIDALSLAACGLPAVALNGTHAPAWLARAAAFRHVIVALDADAAGDAAAARLIPALQAYGARVERWRPDGAKDWNELLTASGDGTARLRLFLFDGLAGPLWDAAHRRHARPPSPELEAAIDAADWPAFVRALAAWEHAIAVGDVVRDRPTDDAPPAQMVLLGGSLGAH